MKLYESLKKITKKPYLLLVINITFASDNVLYFRKNLLERLCKLIMTIEDKISNEKWQSNIKTKTAKKSALIR